MQKNLTSLALVLFAGASLVACGQSKTDAQADAVRATNDAAAADMNQTADAVENQGEAMGGVAEDRAENTADAMRDQADAIENQGEAKADAIEEGKIGVTTKTDTMTTTTEAK